MFGFPLIPMRVKMGQIWISFSTLLSSSADCFLMANISFLQAYLNNPLPVNSFLVFMHLKAFPLFICILWVIIFYLRILLFLYYLKTFLFCFQDCRYCLFRFFHIFQIWGRFHFFPTAYYVWRWNLSHCLLTMMMRSWLLKSLLSSVVYTSL